MSFGKGVKTEALTLAARHCCVCHRYLGVKIEVHHIVPESEGGTNELDNAIAVCFDCHADAGHYYSGHPRGTKYSPEELIKARKYWYKTVLRQSLSLKDDASVYCRYLVCKAFDIISEISVGKLSDVPEDYPILYQNEVNEFMLSIVSNYEEPYRNTIVYGESWETKELYQEAHPDVTVFNRSTKYLYPFYEALRIPDSDELHHKVGDKDFITQLLLENRVPSNQIAIALAYLEMCGDAGFQEIFRIRPVWYILLSMKNISDKPLMITSIQAEKEITTNLAYRQYYEFESKVQEQISLPPVKIESGYSILVPLMSLLGPIDSTENICWREEHEELHSGRMQVSSHERLDNIETHIHKIGPSIIPRLVTYEIDGIPKDQELHVFDLSNVYTINRYWEFGSCPHMFYKTSQNSDLVYVQELFAIKANKEQKERIIIPENVERLFIAELEYERTILNSVRRNGIEILSMTTMEYGDVISIDVKGYDEIELFGFYTLKDDKVARITNSWERNQLIRRFMQSNQCAT